MRPSGRKKNELRTLKIKRGVLAGADGSAYVEWGKNKIICGVFGPRQCLPKHTEDPYKARINVRYTMSPFASKEEHGRAGPNRRSIELSKVIREVFENVIFAEKFPRTQIDIFIEVLQADGGTRTASITAASVALADAGIPMKGMVQAVAGGKANDEVILDLDKIEDNLGQSDVAFAMSRDTGEILLLQMDGLLSKEEFAELLDMFEGASERIYELQRKALLEEYEKPQQEEFRL